ncbi:MAG: carboxymuconolactone decarboxylase family protein [Bacteroidota bacterium]
MITAARYVGSVDAVRSILSNPFGGQVSERVAHLLTIAGAVRTSGANVTDEMVAAARAAGATDVEIHDTVLIAALFSYYNRYVDGMATDLPSDDMYYEVLADRLTTDGYIRKEAASGTH